MEKITEAKSDRYKPLFFTLGSFAGHSDDALTLMVEIVLTVFAAMEKDDLKKQGGA